MLCFGIFLLFFIIFFYLLLFLVIYFYLMLGARGGALLKRCCSESVPGPDPNAKARGSGLGQAQLPLLRARAGAGPKCPSSGPGPGGGPKCRCLGFRPRSLFARIVFCRDQGPDGSICRDIWMVLHEIVLRSSWKGSQSSKNELEPLKKKLKFLK